MTDWYMKDNFTKWVILQNRRQDCGGGRVSIPIYVGKRVRWPSPQHSKWRRFKRVPMKWRHRRAVELSDMR